MKFIKDRILMILVIAMILGTAYIGGLQEKKTVNEVENGQYIATDLHK